MSRATRRETQEGQGEREESSVQGRGEALPPVVAAIHESAGAIALGLTLCTRVDHQPLSMQQGEMERKIRSSVKVLHMQGHLKDLLFYLV